MGVGDKLFGQAETALKTAGLLRQQNADWTAVYYHSGFAVEQALWAVRCRKDGLTIPDHDAVPGHSLRRIATHVGLGGSVDARCKGSRPFHLNWKTVCDWDSNARFRQVSRPDACDMLLAVANPGHGVMVWLRNVYQSLP